jgi:hypothetical protein
MLHLLSNQSIVANLTLRFLVGLGLSVQRATFKACPFLIRGLTNAIAHDNAVCAADHRCDVHVSIILKAMYGSALQFVGPALFGIGAADMGYVMSYSAVLSLFSNVFVVVCSPRYLD